MADGSVSIRIPPEKGYGLTLDCDLSKIQDEAQAALFCSKIASVRALVQVRLPTQTNEPSARLPSQDQESDASFSLSLSLSLDRYRPTQRLLASYSGGAHMLMHLDATTTHAHRSSYTHLAALGPSLLPKARVRLERVERH